MSRPRTISNDEIIDAAREMFLEHGASVTTAEIAAHAGISEGTIFKRFPTKHALLMAAMGLENAEDPREELARLVGVGSMRENLSAIALRLMGFYRQLIPRVMVLCAKPGSDLHHQGLLKGPESPHRHAHLALAEYLKQEIALGRLGEGDPEIMARLISAAIWNFVFFETLGSEVYNPIDGEEYVARLVDTLWCGLAPREATP